MENTAKIVKTPTHMWFEKLITGISLSCNNAMMKFCKQNKKSSNLLSGNILFIPNNKKDITLCPWYTLWYKMSCYDELKIVTKFDISRMIFKSNGMNCIYPSMRRKGK